MFSTRKLGETFARDPVLVVDSLWTLYYVCVSCGLVVE